MNRRGFLGTITALAGIVLAKIKAPTAPVLQSDWYTPDISKKAAFFNELGLPLNERVLIGIASPYPVSASG